MSEEHDEALMRSLFAEGARPPMGDETFVSGVMARVEAGESRRQSVFSAVVWTAGAGAALFGTVNFTTILAEVSRAAAAVNLPVMGGGASMLLMIAAVAGGAWLFSERT